MRSKAKSPYRLNFDDAINAAIYLVSAEHGDEKPCSACKKTLRLLKEVKERLDRMAIGDNNVWYAYLGDRRLVIPK